MALETDTQIDESVTFTTLKDKLVIQFRKVGRYRHSALQGKETARGKRGGGTLITAWRSRSEWYVPCRHSVQVP